MDQAGREPVAPMGNINRRSPIPYYLQLKENLVQGIEAGNWLPGDRLPSEAQLCDQFGVSRTVVRQALQELAHEGLVLREKGRGTFVAEPKISSSSLVHSLVGFYEDMQARGQAPLTEVLEQVIEPAGAKLAARLQLEAMTPVIKLVRLRYVGSEPIVLVSSYLPYALCPKLVETDMAQRSLYAFLKEEYGLSIAGGRRTIEAVLANEREAELLKIGKGDPLLRLASVSFLPDGRPLEYFNGVFRGDRSRFQVQIGPVRSGTAFSPFENEDWLG